MNALNPGSTVGILGGGQLGRMLAMAAARLGYRTIVLDPNPESPAFQVANEAIVAAYDDRKALVQLTSRCDVVTYEFENVPVGPARQSIIGTGLYPPPEALEVAQDRVVEKAFLNGIGIETAPWRAIGSVEELGHALVDIGTDCILKTRRFGYDGKGQANIRREGPVSDAFESLGAKPCILEGKVPFVYEASLIAARGQAGDIKAYDPADNEHSLGILRRSSVPGRVSATVADAMRKTGAAILDKLTYVGVIGVEFFVRADDTILVNEIAPRVHNSGHWTEAACAVSQFEQHIRAVCGLPLGDPVRHSNCVMENLIGDEVRKSESLMGESDLVLHLYGKSEVRAGRKMGHFTRLTAMS
ncbi:5-(carboxyamino)imidazole ribonucleotide synthase [Fulvimarina sp. 2208YS6-2-32]|uniref:N5-carboxyaminoimidazole ribonucleotide synthase n=1 Tax=Fulvimarina uroteuthidis TaxID=3098149 RepID=A0ABU5HX62_9HYPH|nr:5-(carboxyamino)imidazole ribonucleotide synthase [Fulvimarina sp. 2208YS6-2-32]MDY8107732.1 5-(carboxyamino)imidazole ribonucleotide synthase [Fulvimarina sp. 2208YS6-2-32]